MLQVPHRDEPAIRALIALLAIDGSVDIATITDRMNLSGHTLRRISVRYFGLSPKLLLMRGALPAIVHAHDRAGAGL